MRSMTGIRVPKLGYLKVEIVPLNLYLLKIIKVCFPI